MPKPDPPITIRQRLIAARRLPNPPSFDVAWEAALKGPIWPHATEDRRLWKEILAEQRPIWEAAYRGEEVPGGRVLAQLAEVLRQADDHLVHPPRLPVIDRRDDPQHKQRLKAAAKERAKQRAAERQAAA